MSVNDNKPLCQLCGEQMPKGEEMFNYHGFSGSCPKPLADQSASMNDNEDEPYLIAMNAYHAGSTGQPGKTIHTGTVKEWTDRIEALITKRVIAGKIEAIEHRHDAQYMADVLKAYLDICNGELDDIARELEAELDKLK